MMMILYSGDDDGVVMCSDGDISWRRSWRWLWWWCTLMVMVSECFHEYHHHHHFIELIMVHGGYFFFRWVWLRLSSLSYNLVISLLFIFSLLFIIYFTLSSAHLSLSITHERWYQIHNLFNTTIINPLLIAPESSPFLLYDQKRIFISGEKYK